VGGDRVFARRQLGRQPEAKRNHPVNARHHARLARTLIDLCGGPSECATICRLKKSRLAEFCDPNAGAFLPADVIAELEIFCGDPLYSRALFEAHPAGRVSGELQAEACETTEVAAGLQALLRAIGKRGIGAAARRQAIADLHALEDKVRAMLAALDGEDGAEGDAP
jgi:hypothetical protein